MVQPAVAAGPPRRRSVRVVPRAARQTPMPVTPRRHVPRRWARAARRGQPVPPGARPEAGQAAASASSPPSRCSPPSSPPVARRRDPLRVARHAAASTRRLDHPARGSNASAPVKQGTRRRPTGPPRHPSSRPASSASPPPSPRAGRRAPASSSTRPATCSPTTTSSPAPAAHRHPLRRPHLRRRVRGTDPSTDLAVITVKNAPSDLTPDRHRRLRQDQGRRPGHGRGQPARPRRHRHHGHRQRAQPPGHHRGREQPQSDGPVRHQRPAAAERAGRDQRDPDLAPRSTPATAVAPSSTPAASSSASTRRSPRSGLPRRPVRQHRHRLRDPGQRGHLDRQAAHRQRHRGARLPRRRPRRTAPPVDGSATRAGAEVTSVGDGTPAAKAGLKVGDVIVAVNGERVDSADSLVGHVREKTAGDTVTLTVLRDGKSPEIKATLGGQAHHQRLSPPAPPTGA